VSSIRLFVLAALEEHGPAHGHQIRLLAEEEHIHLWTDISVGSLYGVLKRLAAEDLINEVRSEREGAYPERVVYEITDAGRSALGVIRLNALREIVIKPDPFDLAMARLDRDRLDYVPTTVQARIATLTAMLSDEQARQLTIEQYLTVAEKFVMSHRSARIRAEIAWQQELLAHLPEIIADESARKDSR
jgi:DNA-binding PadR family transcriptional regulator